MSPSTLQIVFTIFVVVVAFYAIYGLLVRRPLVRELRRQIRACANQLEALLVIGKIKEDDPGYKILRVRITKAHEHLHLIDMAHLLLAFRDGNGSAEAQHADDNAIIAATDSELEKIRKELDSRLLAALGVNSPVWAVASLSFVCLLVAVIGMGAFTGLVRSKLWDILDPNPVNRMVHA
jgi:hypothetical protein